MTKKLILLAEDDQDDRSIFEEVFREIDNATLELRSLEDGIDLINHLKDLSDDELPQLFVLDQNMPKMTGKATLAYLKSHERYKSIPVVIYSTYPDSRLSDEFCSLGAEQVVAKPDSYEGFKKMVRGFIATYAAHVSSRQQFNDR